MAKSLTPDEQRTYERLYGEWKNAINAAHEMLVLHGMDSAEFTGADAKTTEIWKRLRDMQGNTGAHWSS